MRARIGDLAIVKFDPSDDDKLHGRKWNEMVCIVIGCSEEYGPREYELIYWYYNDGRFKIQHDTMPSSRLVRARLTYGGWDGTLQNLTLKNVEPIKSLTKVVK